MIHRYYRPLLLVTTTTRLFTTASTNNNRAIVTASLNGVLTDPQKFNVPVTAAQMATAAKEVYDEGASVVHIHFRNQETGKGHLPTWDPKVAKEIAEAIRAAAPSLLINFTTGTFGYNLTKNDDPFSGGALGPTKGPIACLEAGRPEMAALNSGSLNYLRATEKNEWAWKPQLFDNPVEKVKEMVDAMNRLGVVPECECFDLGIVRSVAMFERLGFYKKTTKVNVSFVMGVASGLPTDPDLLPFLIKQLNPRERFQWQVIAIGREEVWPLLRRACEVRVVGREEE